MRKLVVVLLVGTVALMTAPVIAQQAGKSKAKDEAPNGLVVDEKPVYIYKYKEHDIKFATEDGSPTQIDGVYVVETLLGDAAGREEVTVYCDLRVGAAQTSYPVCPVGNVNFTATVGKDTLFSGSDEFRPGIDAPGCDPLVGVGVTVDLSDVKGKKATLQCVIEVEDDQYTLDGSQWVWAIPGFEYEYEGPE